MALDLEIENDRAFVVLNSKTEAGHQFKTRIEIDPFRLQKPKGRKRVHSLDGDFDFFYQGLIQIPKDLDI
jgi:hypothetical protein